MTVTKLVGENIRTFRTLKGIKLETLASKIHIDKSTLSKLETGRINITIERAANIAQALGINFYDLIAVKWPMPQETEQLT